MLFKQTIFSTKRFFKSTIRSFKSLFSGGNERLPKSCSLNPFSCAGIRELKTRQSFMKLENFSAETTNQCELNEEKTENKVNENVGEFKQEPPMQSPLGGEKMKNKEKCSSQTIEEGTVLRMLKQLELMDVSNLDIEDVLHYYSRLTSEAYLEIVDRFFMQMYSEILHPNDYLRGRLLR